MNAAEKAFRQLSSHAVETRKLSTAQAVLEWDQQTMLPRGGGEYRAEQIGLLAGMVHRRITDPQVGHWLEAIRASELAADRSTAAGASIFQWNRQFQRLTRVPVELVEELARTCSLAQMAWTEARARDDFDHFAPHLARIFELKRRQADALGGGQRRYDALLDEFEPMARTEDVARVLSALTDDLVPLLRAVSDSGRQPDDSFLRREFPRHQQQALGRLIAEAFGFDFRRGRVDETAHPFCTDLGPGDCRITTRFDKRYLPTSLFGMLHETGHGLYEQGRPAKEYGLPSGDYCSLGIHESQSRLWENFVARSFGFCEYALPMVRKHFPGVLDDISVDQFFAAVNRVAPSLIRVEADETTYNLHIVIRFELELALLEDRLSVDDLPSAWNDAYEQHLGVRPANNASGVLQDIHWSAGLIGYFPTYALGNVCAAQLFKRATAELGPLDESFAHGDFKGLLDWLRTHVHSRGNRQTSAELIECVTERPIDCRPLIDHLRAKVTAVYGLTSAG